MAENSPNSTDNNPSPGLYRAVFLGIDAVEHPQLGDAQRFVFRLAEGEFAGREVYRVTEPRATPRSEAGRLIEGILGAPIEIDTKYDLSKFVGQTFLIQIEEVPDGYGVMVGAVTDPPDSSPSWREIVRGESLFAENRVDEALEVFNGILETEPDNADALNDAAIAHASLGNADAACECLERALAAKPEFESAFYNLVDIVQQTKGLTAARETFVIHDSSIPESPQKISQRKSLFGLSPD